MAIEASFFEGRALHEPDGSLGFVLWRSTHAWQRFLEQRLAPFDLTHLRWALLVGLGWLTRSGTTVSQRELADFLTLHPMQVSQVLGGMERAALIDRRANAVDRRAFDVTLTADGEALLRRAMPVVEVAHRDFFERAGLPADDLRQGLLRLLT